MSKNKKLGCLEHLAQMQNLKSVGVILIHHVCFQSAIAQQLPRVQFYFQLWIWTVLYRERKQIQCLQDKVLMVDQSLLWEASILTHMQNIWKLMQACSCCLYITLYPMHASSNNILTKALLFAFVCKPTWCPTPCLHTQSFLLSVNPNLLIGLVA